ARPDLGDEPDEDRNGDQPDGDHRVGGHQLRSPHRSAAPTSTIVTRLKNARKSGSSSGRCSASMTPVRCGESPTRNTPARIAIRSHTRSAAVPTATTTAAFAGLRHTKSP